MSYKISECDLTKPQISVFYNHEDDTTNIIIDPELTGLTALDVLKDTLRGLQEVYDTWLEIEYPTDNED